MEDCPPNQPGVDATYLGDQELGFNNAELKPVEYDYNQIGNWVYLQGPTSVWWYNSNGIIGFTGLIFVLAKVDLEIV